MRDLSAPFAHTLSHVNLRRARNPLLLRATLLGLGIVLLVLPVGAQDSVGSSADGRPLVTIKELMEKTITPATNTLWNAFEPPTDDQWAALEEAAITLLAAANVVALGGTGPKDNGWAKEPTWKAFNQAMINAGYDALKAVRARDLEALTAAGEVLYPPCEGCHSQFNPGVVDVQQ